MNVASQFDLITSSCEPTVHLGFIKAEDRGAGDLILTNVATRLIAAGFKVHGAVQSNSERADGDRCDMDIVVLPSGQKKRVSQALGPGSSGCRLNNDALEQAVAGAKEGFTPGADLLIINKFGKQEAGGGGFRDLIGDAVTWGVPVLTCVSHLNYQEFMQFSAGMETQLPADETALLEWVHQAAKRTQSPLI